MVRAGYFYATTPIVLVVGTAVLLTIPYLAVIVLMAVLLAVIAAIASALYKLVRTFRRPWQARSDASQRTALHAGGAGREGKR